MIYLDNAATSWPKPPSVIKAMVDALERAGGNPGRSGHRLSVEASRIVFDARETIAKFFNLSDPQRVIFTNNATHAINVVLKGLLRPGDSVAVSALEHNAVMRPLRALENRGVRLYVIPCREDGSLNLEEAARIIENKPRLVVVVHASNVTGTVLPVSEICSMSRRLGVYTLIDAAQTAGVLPIDIKSLRADFIAFTGHKGLQGPPGIGGLLINPDFDVSGLQSLMQGGTGSRSEFEEQPDYLPDKYECGTLNLVGIAGLLAGVRWIEDVGIDEIANREIIHLGKLIDCLSQIPGIKLYGQLNQPRTAILSFTAIGKSVSEIGFALDEQFAVLTRVGLHCAPAAHRAIGTFPGGTVRLAPGIFTTGEEMRITINALESILDS